MFKGNNLSHELLLPTRQRTKLRNAFENNMSNDIKLSETQISKIIQSRGFLGRLLGPLLKTGLPLIKNVIKPLAKCFKSIRISSSSISSRCSYTKENTWLWNNTFNDIK